MRTTIGSQEDIYTLCGRDDAVATITLNPDSDGYSAFGEDVTVCFEYTPKERKALDEDSSSLNREPCVKARALLPDYDAAKAEILLATGVNPHDIIQIMFLSRTIVPWASEWLYFYELWVITGEWLGEGIGHSRKTPFVKKDSEEGKGH